MELKNDIEFDWLEAYVVLKKLLCSECNRECNEHIKIICIEHFLMIVENWEIAYIARMKKGKRKKL